MPALSDVAKIVVSTTGSPVTRIGFGTPLILDSCNAWGASADRVRTYRTLADLLVDGFVTTDPVYLAANSMLNNNPAPDHFKVGRRANKPTQQWTVIPTAQDNHKYVIVIDGQSAIFTSGTGATLAQIIAGLKTAIDALGLAVTTVNVGPNTSLTITATAAGAWHSLRSMNQLIATAPEPYLAITQTQADPGVAADLDAVKGADDDWYGLLMTTKSKAEVLAAAAWIEALQSSGDPKMFFASTQDTDTWTNSATDVMSALKTAQYSKTAAFYYPDNAAFLAAGIAGSRLPTDPGSENWMFASPTGIVGTAFTASQQANLDAKNGNYFYSISGRSFLAKGKVANGQWIDIERFLDWLQINMAEDILQLQIDLAAQGKKVPFDDAGITSVQNILLGRLKEGVRTGGLAPIPAPVVNVPLASSISSADRSARVLRGVTFTATLSGAIDLVSVSGVLA